VYRLGDPDRSRGLGDGGGGLRERAVPAPLAIGTVTVEEGDTVAGARDISGYGGWRTYLAGREDAR
jgi:hypothetical protein